MMDSSDISIVLPVYNDPEGITTTLDSLLNQTAQISHEIIIVDNDSIDQTQDIARSYESAHEHITLVHETEIQSSYASRNTGIEIAEGDILAFLDADMTVPKEWLESAYKELEATNSDYMGCNVDLTLSDNPTLAARYDYHTGFPVQQYLAHQQFAPTCCLFVRREVIEDVGRFDHRLISGGDKEFGNRVASAGYEQTYAESVTMYHPSRSTVSALVTKDHRVGRGLCQLQRHYPDRYGAPGIPPRPSGIKSPAQILPLSDRIRMGTLSHLLTVVRGVGYYREYLGSRSADTLEPPDHCK